MKAVLFLEDGTGFEGTSFGAEGEVVGEVVFNTQVVGFQEILTDPAYSKQLVAIGYPHVGNVGVNDRSNESNTAHAAALVVKEYSRVYSNWQATGSLEDFMKKNNVIGLEGIDTRALTIHIREKGEMRGVVSSREFNKEKLVEKAKQYDLSKQEFKFSSSSGEINSKTVIIDIGVNNSTKARFPGATVVPHDTLAEKILKTDPAHVIISSGPGDPHKLMTLIEEVKKLVGKVPIYGIQNGACVLALALGCSVCRMKVGHHGVNHPVVDPDTGRGEISAQNHSYAVDKITNNIKIVHVNLNDKTIEKFQTKDGSCVGTLYFPIDERGKLPLGYQRV